MAQPEEITPINLPAQATDPVPETVTLLLTSDGVRFLAGRNVQLSELTASDGSRRQGLRVRNFAPRAVQQLLVNGYVTTAEMTIDNLRNQRDQLIDVCKALVYAQLYRRWRGASFTLLEKSPIFSAWNRRNPRTPLSYEAPLPAGTSRALTRQLADQITRAQDELRAAATESIREDQQVEPDEVVWRLGTIDHMIEQARPELWIALVRAGQSGPADALSQSLAQLAADYARKTRVPDYLSALIVELLTLISGPAELSDLEPGTVIWNFGAAPRHSNDPVRMQLSVSNRRSRYEDLRFRIIDGSRQLYSEESIAGYYEQHTGNAEDALGLFYLRYVEEECLAAGIQFESFVNRIPSIDQTLMNIIIAL